MVKLFKITGYVVYYIFYTDTPLLCKYKKRQHLCCFLVSFHACYRLVSELCNMCLTLSKILKNLMIWSISYHINVIEFGLWSCGLCDTILKSWHLLTNICKICTSRSGYSDDSSRSVKLLVIFLDSFICQTETENDIVLSFSWDESLSAAYHDQL